MFGLFGPKIQQINIEEVKDIHPRTHVIDIRESYELKEDGKIPGTQNIPMNQLLQKPSKYLKGDEPYYIFCKSGMRSTRTTKALTKAGFNVVNLKGGYMRYKMKVEGDK